MKQKYLIPLLSFFIGILNPLNPQNNCLDFDGIIDYVTFGDVNDLGTSDFTIEAWVFLDGFDAIHKVINKGLTLVGTPSNAGYALQLSDNLFEDPIEFQVGHSDGSITTALFDGITINTWFHLAGVREGTSIKLYIDGQLAATNDTGVVYDVDTNVPLSLGAMYRPSLGPTRYFLEGKLDEVRIWNKARTQTEIQSTLYQELVGDESNLMAYYNFNQGIPGGNNPTETVLFDQTSNNNNGNLTYFALNGDNSNWLGSLLLLPVELISFSGQAYDEYIILHWQTREEVHNMGFQIEKMDSKGAWINIGNVAPSSASLIIRSYEFIDHQPENGENYYRLKQKDFNGSTEILQTISVRYRQDTKTIACYPIPAIDKVSIAGLESGPYQILDNTGKIIENQFFEHSEIFIGNLSPGLYFIRFFYENQYQTVKIIKS